MGVAVGIQPDFQRKAHFHAGCVGVFCLQRPSGAILMLPDAVGQRAEIEEISECGQQKGKQQTGCAEFFFQEPVSFGATKISPAGLNVSR